jgi:hypothetical protein
VLEGIQLSRFAPEFRAGSRATLKEPLRWPRPDEGIEVDLNRPISSGGLATAAAKAVFFFSFETDFAGG